MENSNVRVNYLKFNAAARNISQRFENHGSPEMFATRLTAAAQAPKPATPSLT